MIARMLAVLLATVCLAGCFQVDLHAPRGREVWLISSKEPVEIERRWHLWFFTFGLTIVNEEQADLMIEREQLTEVRLITEDNIPDAGLGILYNVLIPIGLVNQTLVLQGNRAKRAPPKKDKDRPSSFPEEP